jgi:hypothetical protein
MWGAIERTALAVLIFVRNHAAGLQMRMEFSALSCQPIRSNRRRQSAQSVCIPALIEVALPGETRQTLGARLTKAQVCVWG